MVSFVDGVEAVPRLDHDSDSQRCHLYAFLAEASVHAVV